MIDRACLTLRQVWRTDRMDSALPLTRNAVPAAKADAIRAAVRAATRLGSAPDASRLAVPEDAAALFDLFSEPRVNGPIYSLPRPLTKAGVAALIDTETASREAGTGLLFVNALPGGAVMGYSEIRVWPEWAAGELAGALHPSLHGKGAGGQGAAASFAWMFDTLGLDLICETAALTNVATQRMLDGLGFRRMGEITSTRPDGTTRQSLVWEITRAEWRARHGG
jgi:RimJ/RimL family protein N-acetyltransferase